MKKEILEALQNIQQELKAPKGNHNKYGDYQYRSCDDILKAVKPLLDSEKCVLKLSDEIVYHSDTRTYVKATALLIHVPTGQDTRVYACARESVTQPGMAPAQMTGSASSYARKYALSGLFAIDNEKDDDTRDNRGSK